MSDRNPDSIHVFPTFSAFPSTGEFGKVYYDLETYGVFLWTGSEYQKRLHMFFEPEEEKTQ